MRKEVCGDENAKYVWYMYKSGAVCVLSDYVREAGVDLPEGAEIDREDLEGKDALTLRDVLKMDKLGIQIDTSVCGRKAAERYCMDSFCDGDMVDVSLATPKNLNEWIEKLVNDPAMADPNGMFECVCGCVVSDEFVESQHERGKTSATGKAV